MKIGFFHVDRGDTPHRQLADLLIRSARAHMPSVEIVHLTDDVTLQMRGTDDVRRQPAGPIALGCLEAYTNAGAGDWLFVDTDVLIQRDVRWIFDDGDFEIAVAERAGTLLDKEVGTKFMAAMPYNKGAVFSRAPVFWSTAAAFLRTQPEKRQHWIGDQAAMCGVIATGAFRVRVLPNRYNYPPKSADESVIDKAILHFKGARKAWMLERAQCRVA